MDDSSALTTVTLVLFYGIPNGLLTQCLHNAVRCSGRCFQADMFKAHGGLEMFSVMQRVSGFGSV